MFTVFLQQLPEIILLTIPPLLFADIFFDLGIFWDKDGENKWGAYVFPILFCVCGLIEFFWVLQTIF